MSTRQKQISIILKKQLEVKKAKQANLSYPTLGTIYTTGQEIGSVGIWVPPGYKYVRFTCRARAALVQFFMCRVKGDRERIKTDWEPFWKNTVIDIPLDMTNCSVTLSFQAMDSNGGFARWELKS